ncbi:MAG: NUDIX domain-containing protein [Defluviitaleaceae bacterium]|nr:NUDIX domain-containing protein [Defluviitaleaceae bacterium]
MPFKSYSAVFPIILSEDGQKILLHLRQNTGYQDGKWDTAASGHVDEGESAKQAAVRECKEEIGIDVNVADLTFVHLSHHFSESDKTYYHLYFIVNRYQGIPTIMEPDKALELQWFDLQGLPDEMVPCRKIAIEAWQQKIPYTEIHS